MLKKIAKLIDVKSLVTLALTATFIVLSLKGTITADNFMSIFTVIIAFYFGTQVGKKEAKEEQEADHGENEG
ncbi:MAG: hypothetical protein K6E47_00140 [Lachnospiraceae bacterium]|nr:hypothetical protein [Lachnospiraceae bacterium]